MLVGCGGGSSHGSARQVLEVLVQSPVAAESDPANPPQGGGLPVYRTLYMATADPRRPAVPDLATAAPDVSADGRTITVHLRSGVYFGPPVNREIVADDVRYGIERSLFPSVASPLGPEYFSDVEGAQAVLTGRAKRLSGISTPDAHTLVIHLRAPRAGFVVAALSQDPTAPVPRSYAAPLDARQPSQYGLHSVSSGPYMLASGTSPPNVVRLVRNPNWRRATDIRPAKLAEIDYHGGFNNIDLMGRQVLLGSGMITALAPLTPGVISLVLGGHRNQIAVTGASSIQLIRLDTTIPPLDNVNVRRAVLAIVNRQRALLAIGGPFSGALVAQYLTPTVPGFAAAGGAAGTGADYLAHPGGDVALARSYMRRAGYSSGLYTGNDRIRVITLSGAYGAATATLPQPFIRLGMHVDVIPMPAAAAFEACATPAARAAVCLQNQGRSFADPEAMLGDYYAGSAIRPRGNNNQTQLNDPQVNAAIARAETTVGEAGRARAWARVDQLLIGLAPGVPLWAERLSHVRSKDVEGFVSPVSGYVDPTFMSIAQ